MDTIDVCKIRFADLPRSKLLIHIDILRALALHGPLNLTHIMYRVNISVTFLKPYLGFLIERNLIEERPLSKARVIYAITGRGKTVLEYFRELSSALQISEQEKKIPA